MADYQYELQICNHLVGNYLYISEGLEFHWESIDLFVQQMYIYQQLNLHAQYSHYILFKLSFKYFAV